MEPQPEPTQRKPANEIITLLREKWPEYVIEILVIIFSITISFALDEWKETQRKREVEQTYLHGLANDVANDIGQLSEIIAETQLVVRKTQLLIGSGNASYKLPANRATFFNDLRFIMKRPRFVAEDATFAELKSTGNMQLLTSPDLKRALFDYYKDYESAVQVESAELQAVTTIIGPYMISQIPLANGADQTYTVENVINRVEFRNMVFLRNNNRQELLGEYQQLQQQAKAIRQLIARQIDQ